MGYRDDRAAAQARADFLQQRQDEKRRELGLLTQQRADCARELDAITEELRTLGVALPAEEVLARAWARGLRFSRRGWRLMLASLACAGAAMIPFLGEVQHLDRASLEDWLMGGSLVFYLGSNLGLAWWVPRVLRTASPDALGWALARAIFGIFHFLASAWLSLHMLVVLFFPLPGDKLASGPADYFTSAALTASVLCFALAELSLCIGGFSAWSGRLARGTSPVHGLGGTSQQERQ